MQLRSRSALKHISAFIVMTEHSKRLFARGGIPPERMYLKPNFVFDPLQSSGPTSCGRGAVFAGRMAPAKGLSTLIAAWRRLRSDVPLTVVGGGPRRARWEAEAVGLPIQFRGRVPHQDAMRAIREAALLIMPSESYETFGRTIIEAYACGRPVIASRIGPTEELVDPGRTGWVYEPGDADGLGRAVEDAIADAEECARRGREARKEYEAHYTPEVNYRILMDIYHRALQNADLNSDRPATAV